MALKKRKLGTALLQLEKGSNELLADRYHSLNDFAVVNEGLETEMICFTVHDYEGVYFWASTLLYEFLKSLVVCLRREKLALIFLPVILLCVACSCDGAQADDDSIDASSHGYSVSIKIRFPKGSYKRRYSLPSHS